MLALVVLLALMVHWVFLVGEGTCGKPNSTLVAMDDDEEGG